MSIATSELKMWKLKLIRIKENPSNGIDALRLCNPITFPNVYMLLKILCTLPVSTATPERMFSNLKRMKTYLRNTMKEVNKYLTICFILELKLYFIYRTD